MYRMLYGHQKYMVMTTRMRKVNAQTGEVVTAAAAQKMAALPNGMRMDEEMRAFMLEGLSLVCVLMRLGFQTDFLHGVEMEIISFVSDFVFSRSPCIRFSEM